VGKATAEGMGIRGRNARSRGGDHTHSDRKGGVRADKGPDINQKVGFKNIKLMGRKWEVQGIRRGDFYATSQDRGVHNALELRPRTSVSAVGTRTLSRVKTQSQIGSVDFDLERSEGKERTGSYNGSGGEGGRAP